MTHPRLPLAWACKTSRAAASLVASWTVVVASWTVVMAKWAVLVALAASAACSKTAEAPSGRTAMHSDKPEPSNSLDTASPPSASLSTGAASAGTGSGESAKADPNQGLGDPLERRKRPPAVIGGCGLGCSTPEAAVSLWLAQLQSQNRVDGLRPLFDWSVLRVDGEELGARWAGMWADSSQQPERKREIDAWLARWSAWVERLANPQGWPAMRKNGVCLTLLDARTAQVLLRHPPLQADETGPQWRLVWQLRGEEWLLATIEHRPVSAPGAGK